MCRNPCDNVCASWGVIPNVVSHVSDSLWLVPSISEAKAPKDDDDFSLFSEIARAVENAFMMYQVHPIALNHFLDAIRSNARNVVPTKN